MREKVGVLLFLLLFVVGCTATTMDCSATIAASVTQTATKQATATVTRKPTATVTPTKTLYPTAMVEPTNESRPTLAAEDAQQFEAWLQERQAVNENCRFPCWWGITPGESTWEDVVAMYQEWGEIELEESMGLGTVMIWKDGQLYQKQTYHLQMIDKWEIDAIEVENYGADLHAMYDIPYVLRNYGRPSYVRGLVMGCDENTGQGSGGLILFYEPTVVDPKEAPSMVAYYEPETSSCSVEKDEMKICLANMRKTYFVFFDEDSIGANDFISDSTKPRFRNWCLFRNWRCIYDDCCDVDIFYVPALLSQKEACFSVRLTSPWE